MTASVLLDKRYTRDLQELGSLSLRVVVVPRKDDAAPAPMADDDFALGVGKSPIDSYLERSDGRGKMCVLFLLNGQRQDALDQSFIARDLEFRYLRNRTIILVELDGLSQFAQARLLKGDRASLFKGDVFNAIRKRVIDTIKGDPDMERLETEAEEQVAELDGGTEAIRKKLDQLIDEQTKLENPDTISGPIPPGLQTMVGFGDPKSQTVVLSHGGSGSATVPVLVSEGPKTLRLRPDSERVLEVRAMPPEAWATLKAFTTRVEPVVEELEVRVDDMVDGKKITLRFNERDTEDDDQYPIETKLQAVAKFNGHAELRLVEKDILIGPRKTPPPPPPVVLLDEPTMLRVMTRQPVKLVPGGPLAHVRVRWNGKDELISGVVPSWEIHARCTTINAFPAVSRTDPRNGRFELLIDTPRSLLAAQELEFEVEVHGPLGKVLRETFRTRLEPPDEEENEPGTRKRKVPEVKEFNPRPYELKFVTEAEWDTIPYWSKPKWDGQSVGCFVPPTKKDLLVLVVNKDYQPLKAATEEMVAKGLLEATIEERVSKYYAHIALHLYAMYRYKLRREAELKAAGEEEIPAGTAEEFMESEIERAANTVLRLLPS